jgi:hypothetical protein
MNDNSLGALNQRLFKPEFPRSSDYDAHWLIANVMGPAPLVARRIAFSALGTHAGNAGFGPWLRQGAHLDFLAKEFGVTVWAADRWIKPTKTWSESRRGGLDLRIPGLTRSTRATLLREEFRCDREFRRISLLWNRRLVFGVHIVVFKARRAIGYRRPGHSGGAFRSTATTFSPILGLGLLQLSFPRLVVVIGKKRDCWKLKRQTR